MPAINFICTEHYFIIVLIITNNKELLRRDLTPQSILVTKRAYSVPFTTASTLTLWRKSSKHHGCQNHPRRKRDSAPTLSRQSRSQARLRRRWMGPGIPGACRCSLAAAKGHCRRCSPLTCPAAWPAAGPRHARAYSPRDGSATPRPPLGQIRDKWTQTCERRAYTGCSRRRSVRRPPGLLCPLLGVRTDGNTTRSTTTLELAQCRFTLLSGCWLAGLTVHARTWSRGTVGSDINAPADGWWASASAFLPPPSYM